MSHKYLQGVIAIEFFADPQNQPQVVLDHNDMKELNSVLAGDMLALIPGLDKSSMALIGALYQSNEILQPGFPLHKQLRHYINASLKAANFSTNQLVIGAHDGQLPEGFHPPKLQQRSTMFYLPFVIRTERTETIEFFESQLMHKGMGSVQALKAFQQSFSAKIRHLNFMTVLDMAAMMHNHMQMAGFGELWTLLEQALFNEAPECKQQTSFQNNFYLSKKMVFTPFFSQLFWTQHMKLKDQDYPNYLYTQRQYVQSLQEHGLDVRQFLPQSWPMDETHVCFAKLNELILDEDFFKEEVQVMKGSEIQISPINHPQLGVICIQAADESGGQENYYPLNPNGISSIQQHLSQFRNTN